MTLESRARWGLGLFALVLVASSIFVFTRPQITAGLTEDHFEIGLRLATAGDPLPIFRPPGYPVLVAGVVWLCREAGAAALDAQVRAVQLAQCALLAGSSAFMFLWMSQRFSLASSWALALSFGVNPLALVLAGFLHYDMLHLFCAIVSCCVASAGIRSSRGWPRAGLTFAGGVLFGVATVVRPLTLPLPMFVVPALLLAFRPRWRVALGLAALFIVGMAGGVLPVALRNHGLTGRFVPVNAQGKIGLWSATVEPRQALDNTSTPWNAVWAAEGEGLFREVVGQPYSYRLLKERILDLEDAFGDRAIDNILRRPQLYAANVARNAWYFLSGAPTAMVAAHGDRGAVVGGRAGAGRAGVMGGLLPGFELMFATWSAVGLLGIGLAMQRKDAFVLLPAAVILCLCFAHALTYVDFRYLYVKVPFLLLFCAYVVETPRRVILPFSRQGVPLGTALRVALLLAAISTSGALYYATG